MIIYTYTNKDTGRKCKAISISEQDIDHIAVPGSVRETHIPDLPPTEQELLKKNIDNLASAEANQDELLVDQEYRLTMIELGI